MNVTLLIIALVIVLVSLLSYRRWFDITPSGSSVIGVLIGFVLFIEMCK